MIRLLSLIAVFCGFTGTAFAGCAGKITSVSAQSPLTYSPFAAWNALQTLILTVQNTGAVACSYQVSIPPSFNPLQFAGKLSFSISSSSASANSMLTTPTLKPGQSAQLPIILTVPRGQPSLSGYFTSKVGFALAVAGSPAAQPPIDQAIVPLTCTVPPIFEINLAGSGRKTTVQFGNLEAGQKASVILQTRTNSDHRLVFQSAQWRRICPCTGIPARLPQYLTQRPLMAQPVTLTAPVALSFAAEPGEASRRVTVTVGDTSGKLAGTYTDVITVSILSSM